MKFNGQVRISQYRSHDLSSTLILDSQLEMFSRQGQTTTENI